MVEFRTEHHIAHRVKGHHAHKLVGLIHHREDVSSGIFDGDDDFLQVPLRPDREIVGLDERSHAQQSEDSTVLVVGDELTFARQTHGIDTVRLKNIDGHIADGRHNHQWHKQFVTARQLCNEEDTGERCMHHA